MEMSTCCTCGYEWPTGTDGSHSCSEHLLKYKKLYEDSLKRSLAVTTAPITSKQDIMGYESGFDSMIHELELVSKEHADFPVEFSTMVREAQSKLQGWMKKHGMTNYGGDPDSGKENW